MIASSVAYVALVSNDVELTCKVLAEHLGLPRNDLPSGATGAPVPTFTVGRSALAVFEVGDPMVGGQEKAGINHLALAVDDMDRAARETESVGLGPVEYGAIPGLGQRPWFAISPGRTCGLRTDVTTRLELAPHAPAAIERIDHLGIASTDVGEALRIAGSGAELGLPQARMGIIPGWNGIERLVRTVGRSAALRILITGERYGPHSGPPDPARALARDAFANLWFAADHPEAQTASAEKRPPRFGGR
jgi:hypothetical protein